MRPDLTNVFACLNVISDEHSPGRREAVDALPALVSAETVDQVQANGLRPIDILVRGHDDEISALAVEVVIDAGSKFTSGPSTNEAPPLHASCYFGNWMMARAILGYEGVDPSQAATSRGMRLNSGTPAHAVAIGFRAAYAERYMFCLQLLLSEGANLNIADRLRKKPVDVALAGLVASGDRTLVDALFDYGVKTGADPKQVKDASAAAVAAALAARRSGMGDLGVAALKSQMMQIARGN